MSETFANEFSSVYVTGNLNVSAPHQAFCDESHLIYQIFKNSLQYGQLPAQ